MFFLLSKTLYFLAMPITMVVLSLILCIGWKRYRKQFFILGFGLLLLFTNPFLANLLMRAWEIAPKPLTTLPSYKVGIVLGGITADKEPRDRVHVVGDAERILHAIQLYREEKIQKILLSGGSGKLFVDSIPEAIWLKKILVDAQVPERDILIEDRSRNTRENAVNSQALLALENDTAASLLITSAYHMRRAEACFEKIGMSVDIFPVGVRSEPLTFTPDKLLIPNASALSTFEVVIREMVGTVAYRVAGYI